MDCGETHLSDNNAASLHLLAVWKRIWFFTVLKIIFPLCTDATQEPESWVDVGALWDFSKRFKGAQETLEASPGRAFAFCEEFYQECKSMRMIINSNLTCTQQGPGPRENPRRQPRQEISMLGHGGPRWQQMRLNRVWLQIKIKIKCSLIRSDRTFQSVSLGCSGSEAPPQPEI